MNVKFYKITSYILNFQNFTCVFTILVKFDIRFLGLPREIFFGVITLSQSINQSIRQFINVNTWDGVAPIIEARGSCIKRTTVKILSQ